MIIKKRFLPASGVTAVVHTNLKGFCCYLSVTNGKCDIYYGCDSFLYLLRRTPLGSSVSLVTWSETTFTADLSVSFCLVSCLLIRDIAQIKTMNKIWNKKIATYFALGSPFIVYTTKKIIAEPNIYSPTPSSWNSYMSELTEATEKWTVFLFFWSSVFALFWTYPLSAPGVEINVQEDTQTICSIWTISYYTHANSTSL